MHLCFYILTIRIFAWNPSSLYMLLIQSNPILVIHPFPLLPPFPSSFKILPMILVVYAIPASTTLTHVKTPKSKNEKRPP